MEYGDLQTKYCTNIDELLPDGMYYTGDNTEGTFPSGLVHVGMLESKIRPNSGQYYVRYTDAYGKQADRVYYSANGWRGWNTKVETSDLAVSISSIPQIATNSIFTDFYAWNVYLEKYGKLVTIHFNVAGSMVASDEIQDFFALPEGYRPLHNCIQNYPAQDISGGKSMLLVINTDGSVQVYNNNQAINHSFFLRQVITYVAQ